MNCPNCDAQSGNCLKPVLQYDARRCCNATLDAGLVFHHAF